LNLIIVFSLSGVEEGKKGKRRGKKGGGKKKKKGILSSLGILIIFFCGCAYWVNS